MQRLMYAQCSILNYWPYVKWVLSACCYSLWFERPVVTINQGFQKELFKLEIITFPFLFQKYVS